MRIFKNNYRQNFFFINDIRAFEQQLKEINSFLWPIAFLPTLNPHELLDLSSLSYTNNSTYISIHTKIPILSHKYTYPLHAYFPIPFMLNSSVRILKIKPNFYFMDNMNKTQIMMSNTLNGCKTITNHTICNSNVHESLIDMNECEISMIQRKNLSDQCKFTNLETRNYYMQLDPDNIFCFIVTPIKLRITCGYQERIFELKINREINFFSQCEFHKILNETRYNVVTFSSVETNQNSVKPNFSIYDEQTQNWTNDVKFLTTLIYKTRGVDRILNEQKSYNIFNTIGHIPTRIWSSASSFFNSIFGIFYLSLCLYVFIPIVITIISIYFCVRYIKK